MTKPFNRKDTLQPDEKWDPSMSFVDRVKRIAKTYLPEPKAPAPVKAAEAAPSPAPTQKPKTAKELKEDADVQRNFKLMGLDPQGNPLVKGHRQTDMDKVPEHD